MLKVLQEGIVPVREDKEGNVVVDARELHNALGVKKKYTDWIKDRIKKYDFAENVDFITTSQKREVGATTKNITEYILTLDTAKEIAMVQNTEQGRAVRKYFIECEKKLKEVDPEASKLALLDAQAAILERNRRICIACALDSDTATVLSIKAVNNNLNINELIAERAIDRLHKNQELEQVKQRGILNAKIKYIAENNFNGDYKTTWEELGYRLKYTEGVDIEHIRKLQLQKREKDILKGIRPAAKVQGYLDIIEEYKMFTAANNALDNMVEDA